MVLGIVGDLATLFGPWTKTAAFICGLAVCGFVLLSIFKPEHRRRWAVPFVATMMMFTMSICVIVGQTAMAAQERGMLGSLSPNIAAWQDNMAKRLSRIEENTEIIIKQNDKTDTKLDMILDQNKEIKTAVDKNSKKLDAITKNDRGRYFSWLPQNRYWRLLP